MAVRPRRENEYVGDYSRYGFDQQQANPPRKSGRGLTIAAALLIVVGVALIVVALALWLPHQRDYQAVHDVSAQAQQSVTEGTQTSQPVVDFSALKQLNSEIVGWIQIPDTAVNYPITKHSDNDYYLNHALDQSDNPYGCVFMDYRCDTYANDRTTIIYGHHLKNGEEFAKIADYSDQAQFDTLGVIYYVSEDGVVHDLVPLCCMVVNGYDVDSLRVDFADDADFQSYVQSTIDRSSAKSDKVVVQGLTHLYMLSTCSYAQENDRTILVCVDRSAVSGTGTADVSAGAEQIQAAANQVAGVTPATEG